MAFPSRTLPQVTCPGCKKAMMPGASEPVVGSNDLADVRYVWETCGTTSMRRIKLNDRDTRTVRSKRRTNAPESGTPER